MNTLRLAAALAAGILAADAAAISFIARVDEAEWKQESSPFECRLWQPIPVYGEAVFSRKAGEALAFKLESDRDLLARGKALLEVKSPSWNPGMRTENLGYVPVVRGHTPISLPDKTADRLISSLYDGYQASFTRQPWYGAPESVTVSVSPANFKNAYNSYRSCLAELLPVNYSQISRSRLSFAGGGTELSNAVKDRLDLIVRYAMADRKINGFFVDGYTDSRGRRSDNAKLSQRRADAVTRYLLDQGIPRESIVTRFHGEHYPAFSNDTASGRAKNRRVTVRLEKLPPEELESVLQTARERRTIEQAAEEGDTAPDAAAGTAAETSQGA